MASIGMNIARDGSSSIDLVRSLGATWVRIVAMPDVDLSHYFMDLAASGIRILLVLAKESGGDYAAYQRRYGNLVHAVQVGNEPDLDSPSSWTMTPVELASLGRAARQVFGPDMPLVAAGMASGHPEWLNGVDISWASALACHPYLKDAPNPNDIEDLPDVPDLVNGYRALGLPVLITEWGWWGDDEVRGSEEVRDMTRWAAKTGDVECYFHFCLDDGMVPPFGLYRSDGTAKPAAGQYISAAHGAIHSLWPAIQAQPEPEPAPTKPDPWEYFTAEQIAQTSNCPVDAIQEHWPRLVDQLGLCQINDRPTQVAMIGTVAIETAHTFRPVREAFYLGEPEPAESWRRANLRYYPYYGRGFIQLTWESNYQKGSLDVNALWQAGDAIDLVARPDDALDPDVSAATSALYFLNHGGDHLALIPAAARAGNWREVRRLVQGGDAGLDDLVAIANALTAAAPQPEPVPPPTDDRDQIIADLTLALKTLRDETIPAIRAQVDEAERIAVQFVGARP